MQKMELLGEDQITGGDDLIIYDFANPSDCWSRIR